MDHKTNVAPVDAHPERVRRHRDIDLLGNENLLRLHPLRIGHPAVVGNAFHTPARKGFGHQIHLFPRRAVDDAGLVRGDHPLDPLILVRRLVHGRDGQ